MLQRRQWCPTPVLLPEKSHGWRSLVGCGPWGSEGSDMTEQLHFHFSLPSTGEGNGNPLQCSCLEDPRDGGAWWAAVYGVAQSWTRLKRRSSSRVMLMCLVRVVMVVMWVTLYLWRMRTQSPYIHFTEGWRPLPCTAQLVTSSAHTHLILSHLMEHCQGESGNKRFGDACFCIFPIAYQIFKRQRAYCILSKNTYMIKY